MIVFTDNYFAINLTNHHYLNIIRGIDSDHRHTEYVQVDLLGNYLFNQKNILYGHNKNKKQ